MSGRKNKIKHLRISAKQAKELAVHRIDAVHDAVPRSEPELGHHLHVAASYINVILPGQITAFLSFALISKSHCLQRTAFLSAVPEFFSRVFHLDLYARHPGKALGEALRKIHRTMMSPVAAKRDLKIFAARFRSRLDCLADK